MQEDYEVSQAWDFQNTSVETGQYNVRMWFNGTGRVDVYNSFPSLLRVNQVGKVGLGAPLGEK